MERIPDADAAQSYPPGKLITKVTCKDDPSFSYALYLPATYNEKQFWPVLVLFDPHAKGSVPVEKYMRSADSSGFIFACSNESRNSIDPSYYRLMKNAMIADLREKFKINSGRIYLGGFSGGARVAINLALADPVIAGVVANSAGFEPSRAPLRSDLVFAGIAGNEDFNLAEQRRTEKSLSAYSFPHCLIEFNGKHEWAPVHAMDRALLFLDCAAKKMGKPVMKEERLGISFRGDMSRLDSAADKKERFLLLRDIVAFYSGVFDVRQQAAELEKLEKDMLVRKWLEQKENDLLKEGIQQNRYYQKVFTESPEWWEGEAKKLLAERNSEKLQQNKRLLSYISLAVYMTMNSPEAQQDMFQLEKFIAIYSIVDPLNPEWAYQKAVVRARQNNLKEAIELLKKSVELGFDDRERMRSQVEFSALQSDPEFQKLIS